MRKLLLLLLLLVSCVLADSNLTYSLNGNMSMRFINSNGTIILTSGQWFRYYNCNVNADENLTIPFSYYVDKDVCKSGLNMSETADECKARFGLAGSMDECMLAYGLVPQVNLTCDISSRYDYNNSLLSMTEEEFIYKLKNQTWSDYSSMRIWLIQNIFPELQRYNNLTAELEIRKDETLGYKDLLSQCSNSLNATKAEVVTAYKSADDRGVLLVALLLLVTVMVLSQAGIFSFMKHKF